MRWHLLTRIQHCDRLKLLQLWLPHSGELLPGVWAKTKTFSFPSCLETLVLDCGSLPSKSWFLGFDATALNCKIIILHTARERTRFKNDFYRIHQFPAIIKSKSICPTIINQASSYYFFKKFIWLKCASYFVDIQKTILNQCMNLS